MLEINGLKPINQKLYKNVLISKDPTIKNKLDNISSIVWLYKIAPATIKIDEGINVKEIHIFSIELKEKEIDFKVLQSLDKLIKYNLLFYIKWNNDYCYAINYKTEITDTSKKIDSNSYLVSKWNSEVDLSVDTISLDNLWKKYIKNIGSIEVKSNNDVIKQIEANNLITEINKQVIKLTKRMNAEKQPNIKMSINDKIKELKREIIKLEDKDNG